MLAVPCLVSQIESWRDTVPTVLLVLQLPSGLLDMELSVPATLAMVEEDHRMSDADVVGPQIPPGTAERPSFPDVPGSATLAPTSAKRILGELSLSEESLAPASKTVRVGAQRCATCDPFPPLPVHHVTAPRTVPAPARFCAPSVCASGGLREADV